jgi:hypothetical protein
VHFLTSIIATVYIALHANSASTCDIYSFDATILQGVSVLSAQRRQYLILTQGELFSTKPMTEFIKRPRTVACPEAMALKRQHTFQTLAVPCEFVMVVTTLQTIAMQECYSALSWAPQQFIFSANIYHRLMSVCIVTYTQDMLSTGTRSEAKKLNCSESVPCWCIYGL